MNIWFRRIVLGILIVFLVLGILPANQTVAASSAKRASFKSCKEATQGGVPGLAVDRKFWIQVINYLNTVPNGEDKPRTEYPIVNVDYAISLLQEWQKREHSEACWNPLGASWVINDNFVLVDGRNSYPNPDDGARATANNISIYNNIDGMDNRLRPIRKLLAGNPFDRSGIDAGLYSWIKGPGCVGKITRELFTLTNNIDSINIDSIKKSLDAQKIPDELRNELAKINRLSNPDVVEPLIPAGEKWKVDHINIVRLLGEHPNTFIDVNDIDESCYLPYRMDYVVSNNPKDTKGIALLDAWEKFTNSYVADTKMISASSNKCAQVSTDVLLGILTQTECAEMPTQRWTLRPTKLNDANNNKYYQIVSRSNQTCLQYPVSLFSAQAACGYDTEIPKNQLWSLDKLLDGNFRIISSASSGYLFVSLCLEASNTSIVISVHTCNQSINQEWILPSAPKLQVSFKKLFHILLGQRISIPISIAPGLPNAVFATSWPGSDIVMSMITPSGRVIDRNTIASDIIHKVSPTSENYTIFTPEAGTWEITLFGADVAAGGEDVLFEFATDGEVPPPQLAHVDGSNLVLNMGSADLREARHIETEEINEDFSVKQLSANSFSVSAFGLTQIYDGASQVQADGNDGNDTISFDGTATTDLKGGSGDDVIQSGDGADTLAGGDGSDKISGGGGADSVNGGAGSDTISGGGAGDSIHGDDGDDKITGEDGADSINGDGGADTMHGDDGNDQMLGGAGNDKMFGDAGDDNMDGGAGVDAMEGNDGADTMHGGSENDKMYGNAGADTMFGDDGLDVMYGNTGNDTMHGGGADDYMEGNQDADSMFGDDGQDDVMGGSAVAGTADGGDTLSGGPAQDVILGDNGTITRPGGINAYNGSVQRKVVLFDLQTGANDTISGDDGDDLAFGQAGNDKISGGTGSDYLEGNAGADVVSGDAGPDDIIGGGSANDGIIDADRVGNGLLDAGDELHGGDQGDVMAGDNARIIRLVDASGKWIIDPNTGEPTRQMVLFDVEILGGKPINPLSSGSDRMFGDAGKDKMFGQGNGAVTDATGMDPKDSIDNDRNGRESTKADSFDCLDGRDNDGDGKVDAADPQCASAIDDRSGGDEMHGGPDNDYMEGNHGSDWMFGDDGEDDMIGGSSAGDGIIGGPVMPTGLKDGNDVINGNAEDDVLVGDNAQIIRPVDAKGINKRLVGGLFNLAIRDVRMATTPEAAGAFGNDWMSGGAGVDDMYGQLGNDYMEGNDGEDAMLGDLGKIINNLLGINDGIPDPGPQQLITTNAPFFDPGELIYQTNSLYRQVELYAYTGPQSGAGNDTLYGGTGNDAMHGGPGNDVMNGNDGDDRLFTGDDSDAAWGGPGHDIMFGGYGIDYLDVLPRLARADKKNSFPADPSTWFEAAKVDHYTGLDIMYGGWDRDWMQADVSAPGRVNGDRMIDWAGAFNAFYRCDAAYGDWVITRQHSPSLVAFLQKLAQGFGALNTVTPGTSGFRETAIIFPQEVRFNSHPPNPDNPAHFTCGPAK